MQAVPEAPPVSSAPRRRDQLAAERIRDDILRGVYHPGERLPGERDMAARLGVNRGAVREALKTLEYQGLVTTRPGGTRVCALHEASIGAVRHLLTIDGVVNGAFLVQLLDVHEMLLAGAARLAVERGSPDEMLHARELVSRLSETSLSPVALRDLFDEIVDLITRASGNLVLQLWRNTVRPELSEHLDRIRDELHFEPATVTSLSEAIRTRDAVRTEEAVHALLRQRRNQLLDALEEPAVEDATGGDPSTAAPRARS